MHTHKKRWNWVEAGNKKTYLDSKGNKNQDKNLREKKIAFREPVDDDDQIDDVLRLPSGKLCAQTLLSLSRKSK